MKVLFVCHGNICRSPMAEYVFKYLANGKYEVASRATSEEEIGCDMHSKTKEMLSKNNIPYNRHCARQITIEDYNNFDLIVCFDEYNIHNLKRVIGDTEKVIRLLDRDILDPWYTGDFETTFKDIYQGCLNLIKRLDSGSNGINNR